MIWLALTGALVFGAPDGVQIDGSDPAPATAAPGPAARDFDVVWSTAPPIAPRARLHFDARWHVVATAGGAPLVIASDRGVVIGTEPSAALERWGYWPYLVDAAERRAGGRAQIAFADWPAAPVPHAREKRVWAIAVLALALVLAAAFALARRAARRDTDAHARLFAALAGQSKAERAWAEPGIARPLGGFFLFLSATLLALGPYLWFTAVLWPGRVQPFPDVDGLWAPAEDTAMLAWTLADLGIGIAFVQRFATWRAGDPARALKAAQLYVWWELFGGLALFAVGGALACQVLPHTRWALLSRILLFRFALCVPNLMGLFTTFFQAAQRFDAQLGLDLLEKRLLAVALPAPLVLAGRALGRAHPSLGEPMGAILGLGLGLWLSGAATGLVGLVLYKRMKLPLAPLFHAGFDRATVRDLFRFGAAVAAGKLPYFAANFAEVAILTLLLPAYPSWLGIRQLLFGRILFTLWFVWPFLSSGVPAFAEALAAGDLALVRRYLERYLQLGHLFIAMLIALTVGAGPSLIRLALSAEWHPAADYLPLAAAVGAFLPLSWLADALQLGAGRSGLNATLLALEQALRVALFWLLVPRLGFAGILVAILASIALEAALSWWLNHRLILPLSLPLWPTFGAPFAAAALFGAALHLAARFATSAPSAIALFVAAALVCFPAGFLLCSALGGFSDEARAEIARAAELASLMRPVARLLARCARAGRPLPAARR